MRRVLFAGLFLAATQALSAETYVVRSSADSGPGSLRAALAAAGDADSPVTIVISLQEPLVIQSPLRFEGRAPLSIFGGANAAIEGAGNFTLIEITQGADLFLAGLTLQGPGGFAVTARGDLAGPAGKGVFVQLRPDQDGTARVGLERITLSDVAGHGVHVADCDPERCEAGSDASVHLSLNAVQVMRAGLGAHDADGVRVDERGAGDITFEAQGVRIAEVGGDGAELDEGGDGDVVVRATGSSIEFNGFYCDPDLLLEYLPQIPDGAFDKGAMPGTRIPGPVTGSPDDRCIAREVWLYGDGSVEDYEFSIDIEDGFDIDEAGPGGIRATLENSALVGNAAQGLDFDEEDAGGIDLTLIGVIGSDNGDDAVKISEEDSGDLTAALVAVRADGNGGKGAVLEEEDGGNLTGLVDALYTAFNDAGGTGLEARQEDGGQGTLTLRGAQIEDGLETEGVTVTRD